MLPPLDPPLHVSNATLVRVETAPYIYSIVLACVRYLPRLVMSAVFFKWYFSQRWHTWHPFFIVEFAVEFGDGRTLHEECGHCRRACVLHPPQQHVRALRRTRRVGVANCIQTIENSLPKNSSLTCTLYMTIYI